MSCTRTKIVKKMESWIGCKESDGSHKKIIDIYNSHTPRARGYKLKYTDAWCAGTVSAAAIACDATDIIPTEVGCEKMIELCKKKGIWHENENYKPDPGDIPFYDWQDSGKGDNKGGADHVGLVQKVVGKYIYVIEGNYGDAVKVRKIKVNSKYLRGFALPKYDDEDLKSTTQATTKKESAELKIDGKWGKDTTKLTQEVFGTEIDGIVSGQISKYKKYLPNCLTASWEFASTGKGSDMVRAIQALVGMVGKAIDGIAGKKTVKAIQKFLKKKGYYTGKVDGVMGSLTVKAWQMYINSRL